MQDVKKMTDQQLWNWIKKSCGTCSNIINRQFDCEKAMYSNKFLDAKYRFYLCAEEFDLRGLKTVDFSPYEYDEVGVSSPFFTDSLA